MPPPNEYKCDRCDTEYDYEQDCYCPNCRSCQECPCCPCNKLDCDWCGLLIGYKAARGGLFTLAKLACVSKSQRKILQRMMQDLRNIYWS